MCLLSGLPSPRTTQQPGRIRHTGPESPGCGATPGPNHPRRAAAKEKGGPAPDRTAQRGRARCPPRKEPKHQGQRYALCLQRRPENRFSSHSVCTLLQTSFSLYLWCITKHVSLDCKKPHSQCLIPQQIRAGFTLDTQGVSPDESDAPRPRTRQALPSSVQAGSHAHPTQQAAHESTGASGQTCARLPVHTAASTGPLPEEGAAFSKTGKVVRMWQKHQWVSKVRGDGRNVFYLGSITQRENRHPITREPPQCTDVSLPNNRQGSQMLPVHFQQISSKISLK